MKEMEFVNLVILLSTLGTSYGCSCTIGWPGGSLTAPDTRFCDADYGVLVYVIDDGRIIDMNRVYQVKLLVAYKLGSQERDSIDKTHVYTSIHSSTCGTILTKGKYFVLTGHYQREGGKARFHFGYCDYQRHFDTNPKDTYTPPTCTGDGYKPSIRKSE